MAPETLDTLKTTGLADGIVNFKSSKAVKSMFNMLSGPMEGHVGYFNPASVTDIISSLMIGLGEICGGNVSGGDCGANAGCSFSYRYRGPRSLVAL